MHLVQNIDLWIKKDAFYMHCKKKIQSPMIKYTLLYPKCNSSIVDQILQPVS